MGQSLKLQLSVMLMQNTHHPLLSLLNKALTGSGIGGWWESRVLTPTFGGVQGFSLTFSALAWTAPKLLSNSCCSSGVSGNSITCSTPAAPITQGTPMK